MNGAFDIVRAGHIEFLVTDLSSARKYYVDTLGFVVTGSDSTHLYLRGLEDRFHHCLVLTKSDSPGVGHLAFRVRREEDLTALGTLMEQTGLRTRWMEKGAEEGQGRALRVQDPFGFPVEYYCEMESREWMLRSFQEYKGGSIMRLDHFNILLPDVGAANGWYCDRLGFGCSEITETEGPEPTTWAVWLRRKQNCHDIALTTGKGPRVHHAGFSVADRGSIMDCADVLAACGYHASMERGPGRHGVSNAFFLYLRDPDGNRLELFTGDYLNADPGWEPIRWKLEDPQRQTFWGAPAPASWFNEAMRVRSLESGEPVPLADPKIQDRPTYLFDSH